MKSGETATVSRAAPRTSPYLPRQIELVRSWCRGTTTGSNSYAGKGMASEDKFQRAHRILINCEYHKARDRVEDLIEVIEFEYALHQRRSLQLIMLITDGNYRVDR